MCVYMIQDKYIQVNQLVHNVKMIKKLIKQINDYVYNIKLSGYNQTYTRKELKDRQSKGYTLPYNQF